MIANLHIENIAVVKKLDMDFSHGFTVLTGETGAGKSVILKALSLLCGGKFDRDLLRSGEEKALVSAVFSDLTEDTVAQLRSFEAEPDSDGFLYLQRSVTADGKSQTRINGRTVPASVLREVGTTLINIHGQHENQRLLSPSAHRRLLDRYAEDESLLAAYKEAFSERRAIMTELAALRKDDAERERLTEILTYQIKDIDGAKLKIGEEEALEKERLRLKSTEKIAKQSLLIERALLRNDKGVSACEMIDRAIPAITRLADYLPQAETYVKKLEAFRSEIYDIGEQVLQAVDISSDDPQAMLDRVESRLQQITKLERKYGATIEDVLGFRNQAATKLRDLSRSEDRLAELNDALASAQKKAEAAAKKLHDARTEAANRLREGVKHELTFLEMAKVDFDVRIAPCELTPDGGDDICFLISPNAGEPLREMERIASGGELSRIMLALKCVLQGQEETDTLIFDEIDTGISGGTSQKLGIKLRQIAAGTQVLCITHAAQIAATAHHQYKIAKHDVQGRTESYATVLSEQERISEIARIMGGAQITDGLLHSAQELLRESQSLGNQR